jgi:hypothetical protein
MLGQNLFINVNYQVKYCESIARDLLEHCGYSRELLMVEWEQ